MGTEPEGVEPDSRSGYDYTGGGRSVPPGLADLEAIVDGDIRFDAYTRELYATDASIYEATPIAVVFPVDAEDVQRVVRHCWTHDVPVLPRGGGTSLAGQAVNEAVVLDFTRYMDRLIAIDEARQRCTAEPGVILADLNAELAPANLKFAPDPAWAEKSSLGGAIGNNSTGAHSLAYEKTDAYIDFCDVVLADGTRATFGSCSLEDIARRADPDGTLEARIYACIDRLIAEEAETIASKFPAIHRNVSGYNLNRLIAEAETGEINVARLLAGSEGTLAIITSATVRLEPIPPTAGIGVLTYETLDDALRDVPAILDHGPAAIEVVDDVLLSLARDSAEFGDLVAELPDGIGAFLLVEFYADDEAEARDHVQSLIADRVGAAAAGRTPSEDPGDWPDAPRRAREAFQAYDPAERDRFWDLRKSGLPILLSRTSDEKHVAFIEDTAVPAEHLAAYVRDVEGVLESHGTFASFYAHAGPGCLHIRPLVHTKSTGGVETMAAIADTITDLVIEYGGSVSGEHGDGRARTQWSRKQYGETVWRLFRELKSAFDPKGLLNPGQVCGELAMTEHLRFGPEYVFDAGFEPTLNWDNENGFQGMVELCHGCGGCRGDQAATGGVMCPTFRASREEITSTRGRANLLRHAMSGSIPRDEIFSDEFIEEVLALCIGCKGCARDCPSEVDMAKLKAEVTHAYQQRRGIDRRTRLFSNVHRLGAIGSHTTPVSNWLLELPGAGWAADHLLGITRERRLPRFQDETFLEWAQASEAVGSETTPDVLLLPDAMTTYHHPHIARAAVRVLNASGVTVSIPDSFVPSGRAAYSMGRLDLARQRATEAVSRLHGTVSGGTAIVSLEPSDAVMLQSDYPTLLNGAAVDAVAAHTYGLLEYLDRERIDVSVAPGDERITYHGHCHQKATKRANHAAAVLSRSGWEVDILDSGCCGMAGSFGYESEHYSMSKAIGRILFRQIDRSDGDLIVAPGASCRTQLADHLGDPPLHPIEVLAGALEP